MKQQPQRKQRVKIAYTCYDQNGVLLETVGCNGEEPPVVTLGNGELLPALEREVAQMHPGETREITLKPSRAFGSVDESLFFEVPLALLQLEGEPELGMTVELAEENEEPRPGTIVEINDETLLVDCNHPLAGKTLRFRLTLIAAL